MWFSFELRAASAASAIRKELEARRSDVLYPNVIPRTGAERKNEGSLSMQSCAGGNRDSSALRYSQASERHAYIVSSFDLTGAVLDSLFPSRSRYEISSMPRSVSR